MDLNNLSSNWKKLQQEQMDTRSKPDSRKRAADSPPAIQPEPAKRPKTQGRGKASTKPSQARRPTQAAAARDGGQKTAGASVASLAQDHAIPRAGLTVAYGRAGATLPADPPPAAVPNAGLSSTVVVGKYVALDCEMVGVGGPVNERSIVARVSVVDFHGEQVYDSFVRPTEHVTDWRTWISGVSASHMPTARDFAVVQRDIIDLLQGRILVGHDLQQDLDVLHLTHPRRDIRDTQRHPPFRALAGGNTPGLKKLAHQILGLEIQKGPHSSVEDARTCMALYRLAKDAFEAAHAKAWAKHPLPAKKKKTGKKGSRKSK
ncbi:MAG: 3'-5' exonuclease [Phylliscum demangeonii]|nr:MAG: 3'-5' exonuclease [Phylliscum demangeonii]